MHVLTIVRPRVPHLPACPLLQVWGYIDVNRALVPLVRIGDRVAPALRIVVCEPLGCIITTHNGG